MTYTIFMVSCSSLLWYNFIGAWKGDPGVIKVSREERLEVFQNRIIQNTGKD